MEKEFYYQNIEDYVNGKLKGEAKKAFEAEMAADNDLFKEVALYQDLATVSEVIGDENMESMINEIDSELESEGFFNEEKSETEIIPKEKNVGVIRQIGMRKLLSLAASILILVTLGTWWWANANYSNEALAGRYFNQETIESISRSINGNSNDIFKPGLDALNSENYAEAIRFFENIQDSDEAYSEARLYLAVAQFKSNDYQNALANAEIVVKRNSHFSEKARWLQINIMLMSGQTGSDFENLLNDMAANSKDNYYRNEAAKLKKDLSKFWRKITF